MSDNFTEVSSQGWLSRLGGAVKGIFFGIIFIIIAGILLFWNEGRSVKRYQTLKQGRGMVVSADSKELVSTNEGKLVHMSGKATTKDTVTDTEFGVSVNAIRLTRTVQYYQWEEKKTTKERKKVGGGVEKTTEYSYLKTWSSSAINSSNFKEKEGHLNTKAIDASSNSFYANNVELGEFKLSNSQITRIGGEVSLDVSDLKLPSYLNTRSKINGSEIYVKQNENIETQAEIGDVRIKFSAVYPKDISIVSQQVGNTFTKLELKKGSIDLLELGIVTADAMFTSAEESNKTLTWILRVVGVLLMVAGFGMIFKVLEVIADVLPFVGNIVGAGMFAISFLLGVSISFVIIAIAWFAYRPLLSIVLLLIVGGAIYGVKTMTSKAKAAKF